MFSPLYQANEKEVPGIFCLAAWQGVHSATYYYLKNGKVAEEDIYTLKMPQNIFTRHTDNDTLYNIANSKKWTEIKTYKYNEFLSKWNSLTSVFGEGNTGDNTEESQSANQYIIPDSDSRYLTEEEISRMSYQIMRYAKNEIYARRGRIFSSRELSGWFQSRSWYKGTISSDQFDENVFNEYERSNANLLSQMKGGRYTLDRTGYTYQPVIEYINNC